jgi:hypothetical protein
MSKWLQMAFEDKLNKMIYPAPQMRTKNDHIILMTVFQTAYFLRDIHGYNLSCNNVFCVRQNPPKVVRRLPDTNMFRNRLKYIMQT